MAGRNELGRRGEQVAAAFIRDFGMRILQRNWRCRSGEIDIIARDGDTLVVVEVKTRSGRSHGTGLEAVNEDKVARLYGLAARWLSGQGESFERIRIDVVALELFAGQLVVRYERGVS
ncbi:YraN family protein [Thermopolyspora sp. NPDC052614]|uniref:YraN family protein n=1 Tax=Thermopolyspora sp. NPDC052614 TaxID=3155682 RepID=UPI003440F38B